MVRIRYKTGTTRMVPDFIARRLVDRGIARLEPEAVAAVEPVAKPAAEPVVAPVVEPEAPAADELEDLDRDELYALAVERGIEVHHKAGAAKIKAALRGVVE